MWTSAPRPPQRCWVGMRTFLVVMTYSKSRSMAGARLGFALGSRELIADLERLKYATNPYNVNRLTLRLGEAAVDSDPYFRANARRIMATRDKTARPCGRWAFASRIPRPIFCL